VDSEAYEEDNEEEEEDDDAFIERLSNMVDLDDMLNNEVEARESVDSVEDSPGMNVRRSRRTIRAPKRQIEEMGGLSVDDDGKPKWKDCLMEVYEFAYQEMALVGAGIGGGFGHTSELDVKKYNEALRSNDLDELAKWVQGIDEEHARFLFDEVWVAVLKGDFANVIPITMTWALKQKVSGVVRARCNVRGFEQIPHIHYDPDSKSSPVTTQAAVFIVFVLLMMNVDYGARILDVKGAFLKGRFSSPDEVLLLEVPQGFRWVYDKLGEEMEMHKNAGQPMEREEVMIRTKEIFKEWMMMQLGERLKILKQQGKQRGGSRKVYLQMQRTIYGSVQAARAFLDGTTEGFHGNGVHAQFRGSMSLFSMG
jgi:Reverse transcriptase (RNA-dependent DNA polymerase)